MYIQVLGAYAIERAKYAAQYMIQAIVLLGALNGYDIAYGLYHAYLALVAGSIDAYKAYIGIGNVVAYFAELHLVPHAAHRTGKGIYLLLVHFQQLQHQAQRRFLTYTRQPGKLLHRIFY